MHYDINLVINKIIDNPELLVNIIIRTR